MTEEDLIQSDLTFEGAEALIADYQRRIAAGKAEIDAWERLYAVVKPYMLKDPSLRLGEALVLAEVDHLKAQGLTLTLEDRAMIAARRFTKDGVLDKERAARALMMTLTPWDISLVAAEEARKRNIKLIEDDGDEEL
jgi:hypothetical protein